MYRNDSSLEYVPLYNNPVVRQGFSNTFLEGGTSKGRNASDLESQCNFASKISNLSSNFSLTTTVSV